jgi:hypothetical protein
MVIYDLEDKFKEKLKEIESNDIKKRLVELKNIVVKRNQRERFYKEKIWELENKYSLISEPILLEVNILS